MHKNFVSNEAYKTETAKLGISYPKFSEFVSLYQPGVFEFGPDERGQGMFQERLNLDVPTEIYSGPSFKSDNSPIDLRLVEEWREAMGIKIDDYDDVNKLILPSFWGGSSGDDDETK